MLKKLIILIVLIQIANVIYAQHSFDRLISSPEDQVINQAIEDEEGNFVLVGKLKNNNTNLYDGYLIKLNMQGELLNELVIQNSDSSSLFFNIHNHNNFMYVLGEVFHANNEARLWFIILNGNLSIVDEQLLYAPTGRWFSYMKSIIDSDTNIVITGYTTREDTTGPSPIPYNNDPFFYKLSLSGDSLTSYFMSLPHKLTLSTDIIEKGETPGYFAFGNDFVELPLTGQRYEISKDFDSINVLEIPYHIRGYISSTWLNDTSILLCGQGGPETTPSYSLNVLSTLEDNAPIDYNYFKIEGDMRDHPALFSSVSRNGDNIYIGGNSNFDYANPFWSSNDSWYHLIKINPDITPIWEYWYGGDAYYFLYSILATNDGGCLMVGNRYDDQTQYMERDIYIAKVNSDGLIVWTQEIPIDLQVTTVYPNPGTNQLNIKTKKKDQLFELININGQVVIEQILFENRNTINTESLNSGMYFYRLIDEKNKSIETGKWIKK